MHVVIRTLCLALRALLAALLATAVAGLAWAGPARAQTNEASTFLSPFPEGDRYRVQVYGDAMAGGLLEGLAELIGPEPRFVIKKDLNALAGLLRIDLDEAATTIEARLKSDPPHIVVVMLGVEDRTPIRRNNRRFGVGSPEWKVEYARRLDVTMQIFRRHGISVFWLGLPVMRREDANSDADTMNELFRARALANGARFVDVFASFADADKGYDSHGPDLAGKIRLLRQSDGVHFTEHGNRKLAYFVERELRRAAQQAWDERTIPLAGAEAEQARIRPAPTVKLAPLPPTRTGGTVASKVQAEVAKRSAPPVAAAGSGIAAENGKIVLKSIGAQGREESIAIEILRPAIPAAVVQLLTRRESEDKASVVGDQVMTEILGGLTVVSSITPLAETAGDRRRGASDASSPLRRVLQRGETLAPKPGRSDDLPWPRPEPVVERVNYAPTGSLASRPVASPEARAPGEPPLPRRPSWSGTRRARP